MATAKRAITLSIFIFMTMVLIRSWLNNQNDESSVHGRYYNKIYDYETTSVHTKIWQNRTHTDKLHSKYPSQNNSSYYPEHPIPKPSRSRVMVILLGNMRTGSSYVGEIFNQNSDFFYVFEPLHSVDERYNVNPSHQTSSGIIAKYASALRNIPKCKFSSSFVADISNWGLAKKMSMDINQLCQKRLTGSCQKFTVTEAHSFVVHLSQECMSRKHFATKTIRADFSLMKLLIKENHMDFKIIQLIRDPRGVANARKNYYVTSLQNIIQNGGQLGSVILNLTSITLNDIENSSLSVRTIKSYCKWMWDSMGWIYERPDWLRNRYKLIRYEDFVMDPIKTSQQIYDFIGVPYPESVKSWLDVANKTVNTKYGIKYDLFQTRKKKSIKELFRWRKSLTFEEVNQVQETCAGVLQALGYIKFNSDNELKDDTIRTLSNLDFGDNSG
ncbi:carbohydrate sulfotransferase 1-like isoform X2 [Anneissia japonica]|nr:carbohydrate sulfotransferase 1-like isoform X2 [Anneissia japonica]XP_033099799.1 carbohydrate sulfotransferase 1-like isoform X2 [Anneissia japonica]